MKILMTADTVGGVWTYALELARALGDHQIALATMGALLSPHQRQQAEHTANLEIFESDFKLEWMQDPWRDVERAGDWLLELQSELRPDVVHLNGYAHGALEWSAPVLMAGHSCVLSWWRAVRGEAASADWNRYRREVARGLQAADLVVAPTSAMLQELEDFYAPLPQTQVIFNGRASARFAPANKQDFILTAGRLWDEAKNIAALEKVAPRLKWPVCVAGDECGPEGGSTPARGVRSLGWLNEKELAGQMARAAIYALPARYEPFGLSALEAGLSGCALVLGDIPSLREVWGEAAFFVAPDDADALEAVLRRLIENQDERTAAGQRARARALQFTPQRMAQEYRASYQKLARLPSQQELAAV